jgi:hypothetical protein
VGLACRQLSVNGPYLSQRPLHSCPQLPRGHPQLPCAPPGLAARSAGGLALSPPRHPAPCYAHCSARCPACWARTVPEAGHPVHRVAARPDDYHPAPIQWIRPPLQISVRFLPLCLQVLPHLHLQQHTNALKRQGSCPKGLECALRWAATACSRCTPG